MTERGFDFAKQNLISDVLSSVGLFIPEDISKLFATDPKMKEVEGKHVGLFTSENLYTGKEKAIKGVWKQHMNAERGEGRVSKHDHGKEGITEIIIADESTNYAGLPKYSFEIGKYKIYIIKPGVEHGSDEDESSGRWLSIKFKD